MMDIPSLLSLLSKIVFLLLLYCIGSYYSSYAKLKNIPGPFLAKISNLWLFLQARQGKRYLSVDNAHKKYGKFLRIQPNHVSIADESAINHVYGHGNGFLKSDYYNAFVTDPNNRSIFTTLDRAEHSRKRRNIAHAFSTSSVSKYEKHMSEILGVFVERWNNLIAEANDDYVKLDCLHWLHLLAFDIIGDLAFGKSFNLIEKGEDITKMKISSHGPLSYVPVIKTLTKRGEVSGALGCLPYLIPFASYIPFTMFREGVIAAKNLYGIATYRVHLRLEGTCDPDRVDILSHLTQYKDLERNMVSHEELIGEAYTHMIAGSDTTSNTSCAILYWILRTPRVLLKLKLELDAAIPRNVALPTFEAVKDLPYLYNIIREVLRLHSPSSLGLPRVVPPGPGVTYCSHHFPADTILSVPTYTIHHSTAIWGEDVEEFVPERWDNLTERQKSAFIPFSYGPRACIGRNIAMMELSLIIATLIHWWDFKLCTENLETFEGFLRKPKEFIVEVRKRS